MASDELRRELEALRAEVQALGRGATVAAEAAVHAASEAAAEAAPGLEEELRHGLEEVVHLLRDEIQEHPTAAALTAFALGVVVGRALR